MSKFDSKKVMKAKLHVSIHHPEAGNFGPALELKGSAETKPVLDMTLCEPFVEVVLPSIQDKKKGIKVLVPISGFLSICVE